MKKTFFILLIFILSGLTMSAQTVSESVAQSRAAAFFANQAQQAHKAPNRVGKANQQLTLAYTARKDGNTCFYVYNRGNDGGYVIVGGDEQAKEILAYVPQGHFVYDSLPDNLKWWLDQYAHEIDTAIIMTANMPASAKKAMRKTTTQNTMQDIPDLITTKWNQGEPYNLAIPLIGDDSIHCVTGCVPTALAQIMNYWEYPTHGIGSKSYSIDFTDIGQTVTFSADFANTTYDWTHMRDSYTEGQYTEQDAQAVAVLMYHVGVALEVGYGKYSTGYGSPGESTLDQEYRGIRHDLPEYFGYDEGIEGLYRENFTLEQWKTLLYSELTLGRPVYYSGTDLYSGHAFVCHGYSSSLDMFSFNWGWGGLDDGYYALSGTNAVNGYTRSAEYIIIGIRPAGYNTTSTHLCYGDKFLYNNIWYKVYDEQNRHVEVTHPEIADALAGQQCDFEYCQGHVIIPPVVEHNGINYTVSRIGSYAFIVGNNGQTNINSISLPSSITSLGAGAFYFCQVLTDSILLPDAIEVIPQRCFEQCNRSPYISIPNSLKSIGFGAFYGDRLLEQVTLPEGCYRISPFAFYDCSRLSIVNLPSTMRILGMECFNGTSLIKMTFPCESFVPAENYIEGDYLISNWSSPFPNSIENGTLYVPSALVETYRNTTDKYWNQWGYVASLDSVNPNLGKRFVIDQFEYQIYNDSCVSMTAVDHVDYSKQTMIVPSQVSYGGLDYDVNSIAAKAFVYNGFGLDGIEKLVLSEGIKIIDERAFECTGFRIIELPNSVEKIGREAFNGCNELESLEIPGSVKIAQGVMNCHSLKQVILHEGTKCVGPNFLASCSKLEHAFFPKTIWFSAGGTLSSGGTQIDCESLKSIVSLTDSLMVSPSKVDWTNDEVNEMNIELGNWYGLGYGSKHDSVKLYIPDSLLQDPLSDYNNNYPWNDFPNKLSYVAMTSFNIPDTMSVVQREHFIIPAQFFPANTSYQMLKWTSSDESVVSVSCEGVALARNAGQAIITASAIDGSPMSQSCVINVQEMSIPTDSASFYTYIPSEVFMSDPAVRFDTIAVPITSNGGELFVAFDLQRITRANNLYFSMAGQTFEIFTPSLRESNDVVLRFNNVENVDTLRIRWKDKPSYPTSDVWVKSLRVWNKYSMRYSIQFLDDDDQVLQDSLYQYGSMPVYTGPTPTKADDEHYTYTFEGWTPEIVAVTGDATYTASYLATPIGEGSGFENVEGESTPQKVLIGDQIYILRGDRLYTLQGQEVK